MAVELVNVGTSPDDQTGDPLRVAFLKYNETALYLEGRATEAVSTAGAANTAATEALQTAQDAATAAGGAASEAGAALTAANNALSQVADAVMQSDLVVKTGEIDPAASWAVVPSVWQDDGAGALNAQATALVARQKHLLEEIQAVAEKAGQVLSVKDAAFGAKGDGATDDTAAINAAVSYCRANNVALYWPAGTYRCEGYLNNFHTIRHYGDGIVSRGDDLFYISPLPGQVNRLYVAPTGLTASDALTPDRPVRNVEHAISIIKSHPLSALSGQWVIKMLPGTYVEGVRIEQFPVTNAVITVEGSRDETTQEITSVMDGATSSRFEALNFIGGTPMLRVDSVKFINWRQSGGGGGAGVQTRYTGYCEIRDCYFENCDSAVFVNDSRITLYGSDFINCSYGFRTSYQSNVTTYISQQFPGKRPFFKNITGTAITQSRGSQGHTDYCDFEDCRVGVGISEGGRSHVMGCSFKRCTLAAVRLTGSSDWLDDPEVTNNYHMGTADACARIAMHEGGSRETRVHGSSYGEVAYRQLSATQILTFTGTTDNTVVVFNSPTGSSTGFIVRMPAYYFAERNSVKVVLAGSLSGDGNKTLRLYCGSNVVSTVTTSATGAFVLEFEVTASAFTQQRVTTKLFVNGQTPAIQSATTNLAINPTELQFNTRVQLADPAATVTIRQYEGWVIG